MGKRARGGSGYRHTSYKTARGRGEQGPNQGPDGKVGEEESDWRGIRVVRWAGLDLAWRWRERMEYLLNELKEAVEKEGGFSLKEQRA